MGLSHLLASLASATHSSRSTEVKDGPPGSPHHLQLPPVQLAAFLQLMSSLELAATGPNPCGLAPVPPSLEGFLSPPKACAHSSHLPH